MSLKLICYKKEQAEDITTKIAVSKGKEWDVIGKLIN
jgi:hypothetical protein